MVILIIDFRINQTIVHKSYVIFIVIFTNNK